MINTKLTLIETNACDNLTSDTTDTINIEDGVKQTRQVVSDTMAEAIQSAETLPGYEGQLKDDANNWHYSIGDQTLKLHKVIENQDMTINDANKACSACSPKLCRQLWDGDPMIAAEMPKLKTMTNYWKTSVDSRLASKTTGTAFDTISHCATVLIRQKERPKSIEVEQHDDCTETSRTALLVCKGDPETYDARQAGYRTRQETVNYMLGNRTLEADLRTIKGELTSDKPTPQKARIITVITGQEARIITVITGEIKKSINEILNLDKATLPDFSQEN